jgi:hypothetical protein
MPPLPPPSLMMDVVLGAVLPPLAVAAVIMAALMLLCGLQRAPLAAALGLGAAAVLGLWLRDALPLVPGDSSWNRLPWAALAALWVGRVARLPQLQPGAGSLLRAAAAILVALVVIPPTLRGNHDWLAPAFATVVFAEWTLLEYLAAESPGGSVPLCLAVVCLGAGGVLIHAGSALLMNAAIVLASALAGIALVAWWARADAGGAVPAVAVLAPGILLLGYEETFSEVPWLAFALPALTPLALIEALPLSHWQGRRAGAVRLTLMLVLILVPLATAIYLAHAAGPLDFDVP